MSNPPVEKPVDYIYQSVPASSRQAISAKAEARVTMLVKSALQSYLERYFEKEGIYREQLKLTAGFSVQYETNVNLPTQDIDPTVYEVQFARLWKELRQKLPCVIITDQGFEYQISGLGGIADSVHIDRATSAVTLKMDVMLPINLQIAAMDETTCSDIRDLLIYVFGPLTILNKSHLIYSTRPEDKWEVRLPQRFTPQGLENRKITEDTKDILWVTSIAMDVQFEGSIQIGFDKIVQPELYSIFGQDFGMDPLGFRQSDGKLVPLATSGPSKLDIVVPTKVALNQPTQIEFAYIPAYARFLTDNPRILMVDEQFRVIPKRLGTAKIMLADYNPAHGNTVPHILQEWSVEITVQ